MLKCLTISLHANFRCRQHREIECSYLGLNDPASGAGSTGQVLLAQSHGAFDAQIFDVYTPMFIHCLYSLARIEVHDSLLNSSR